MKNLKKVMAVLCAGMIAFSITGCGGAPTQDKSSETKEQESSETGNSKDGNSQTADKSDSGGGKFKIGIQMKTLDSGFFVTLADEFTSRIEECGWEAAVLNADSDTMKESENMDSFISQGYDLIIIDPYETEGCVEAINRAASAGIPVICVDNSCGESANVVSIVYPSNVKNGLLCGSWPLPDPFVHPCRQS